jgi:hypothetical protein
MALLGHSRVSRWKIASSRPGRRFPPSSRIRNEVGLGCQWSLSLRIYGMGVLGSDVVLGSLIPRSEGTLYKPTLGVRRDFRSNQEPFNKSRNAILESMLMSHHRSFGAVNPVQNAPCATDKTFPCSQYAQTVGRCVASHWDLDKCAAEGWEGGGL